MDLEHWSRDDDDTVMHFREMQQKSVEPKQAHVSELRNPNIVKIAFKFENGPCATNGKWYGIQANTNDTIENLKKYIKDSGCNIDNIKLKLMGHPDIELMRDNNILFLSSQYRYSDLPRGYNLGFYVKTSHMGGKFHKSRSNKNKRTRRKSVKKHHHHHRRK